MSWPRSASAWLAEAERMYQRWCETDEGVPTGERTEVLLASLTAATCGLLRERVSLAMDAPGMVRGDEDGD